MRDLEVNVSSSVKSKEIDHFSTYKEKKIEVYFKLSNLYSLLTAESYQSFSKNKEYLDKLSLKDEQKELEDFNAIIDFIVQEKLLVPTIAPLPKIDMNEVESYALQAIEQGPLNFKK